MDVASAWHGCVARVRRACSSKARSARLLHEHTLQDKLRLFLTFSSIAAAYGNLGQAAYSASKAAAEIVVSSYRSAFFTDAPVRVASARAGNVIGGGDWADT